MVQIITVYHNVIVIKVMFSVKILSAIYDKIKYNKNIIKSNININYKIENHK